MPSSLGGIDPDKLKPPFKRSKIWGIRFSGCKRLSVFDEEDKLLCLFNCRNCHPVSLLFWFRLVFVLFRFVLAVSFRSFCWVPIPPAYKHIERRTPTGSDEAFVLVRIRYTQNNYLTILKRKNTERYRVVFFKDNRTKSPWETRVVSYMWLMTEVRVPKNSVDKELIWMAISGKE